MGWITDFINRIRIKKIPEASEYVDFTEDFDFVKKNYPVNKSSEEVNAENKEKRRATEIEEFFHVIKPYSDFEDPIDWAVTQYSGTWKKELEELDDFDKVAICYAAVMYKARYITDERIDSVGGIVPLINRMSIDARNNAKKHDSRIDERGIYTLEDYMEEPSRTIAKMLEEQRERKENTREQ